MARQPRERSAPIALFAGPRDTYTAGKLYGQALAMLACLKELMPRKPWPPR